MANECRCSKKSKLSSYTKDIMERCTGYQEKSKRYRLLANNDKKYTKVIASCKPWNSIKPHKSKELMKNHRTPELPWTLVSAHIFEWSNWKYLIMIYSYSGRFERYPTWFVILGRRGEYEVTFFSTITKPSGENGQDRTLYNPMHGRAVPEKITKFKQENSD